MIRAEELMIGDWVIDTRSNTPLRVNPFLAQLEVPEWKPIPLTQEILLKNGFENDFYEDVSVADYHSIRVEGYSLKGMVDGWDTFLITFCNGRVDVVTDFHGEFRGEIGYVHTFQHALRLCGINLEIKI